MGTRTIDRRIQRTQELLRGALKSLILESGFERLSVQAIIDRANVGRATFYAHFNNKEDLLRSGLDDLHAVLRERQRRALADAGPGARPAFVFTRDMFAHLNSDRALFQAMMGRRSGAVVQQIFHAMAEELVREEVKAVWPRKEWGSTAMDAVVQFVAGGLVGLAVRWLEGKERLSVDEVDVLFRGFAVSAIRSAVR